MDRRLFDRRRFDSRQGAKKPPERRSGSSYGMLFDLLEEGEDLYGEEPVDPVEAPSSWTLPAPVQSAIAMVQREISSRAPYIIDQRVTTGHGPSGAYGELVVEAHDPAGVLQTAALAMLTAANTTGTFVSIVPSSKPGEVTMIFSQGQVPSSQAQNAVTPQEAFSKRPGLFHPTIVEDLDLIFGE